MSETPHVDDAPVAVPTGLVALSFLAPWAVVSLTLTPMLSSRFLRSSHGKEQGKFYQTTERQYFHTDADVRDSLQDAVHGTGLRAAPAFFRRLEKEAETAPGWRSRQMVTRRS